MNVRTNSSEHNPLKKFIKRSLQHAAASFGRHTRSGKGSQLLVLMYHRILPQDDKRTLTEEPGMTVTPETFRQHISILKKYFDIIKLADWAQQKFDNNDPPRRNCAITFDDGWADNFEFAFPILKASNVPATIFLVSDMIGTSEAFWPGRLARLITIISSHYPQHWSHPVLEWLQKNPINYRLSDTLPTREEISTLIACAKIYSDQEIHDRLTHIENVLQLATGNHPPSLLNWQQVTEMVNSGLVEIGSHSRNHVRLNEHTPNEILRKEIIDSKDTIEKHIGQQVKTFCFPNGDYCPEALTLVKQNYISAVTTKSGWNTNYTDCHLLNRIGIHQDIAEDRTSFLARISGWM